MHRSICRQDCKLHVAIVICHDRDRRFRQDWWPRRCLSCASPRFTVAAGQLAFPVDRVYNGLEQVPQAHDDMEHDRATGKLVVRVRR